MVSVRLVGAAHATLPGSPVQAPELWVQGGAALGVSRVPSLSLSRKGPGPRCTREA